MSISNYKNKNTKLGKNNRTYPVAVCNNEANGVSGNRVTPDSFTRVNSNGREKEF